MLKCCAQVTRQRPKKHPLGMRSEPSRGAPKVVREAFAAGLSIVITEACAAWNIWTSSPSCGSFSPAAELALGGAIGCEIASANVRPLHLMCDWRWLQRENWRKRSSVLGKRFSTGFNMLTERSRQAARLVLRSLTLNP
jgi:hypothetical protein